MKLCVLIITVWVSITAAGQSGQTVFLKWKLPPQEPLVYKMVMQSIDTLRFKEFLLTDAGLTGLFENSDRAKMPAINQFFHVLNKAYQNKEFKITMTPKQTGRIDIEMDLDQTKNDSINRSVPDDNVVKAYPRILKQMAEKVKLRGAIDEDGSLQSFYVRTDQKNLISLMFELPNRAVKVGDTWPLTINLVAMDQNFSCDSAFKRNTCTLVDLKRIGEDTVAVLKYSMAEYVSGDYFLPSRGQSIKSMMKMTYHALASFSIRNGRWVAYDGVMTLHTSGVSTVVTAQKLALSLN